MLLTRKAGDPDGGPMHIDGAYSVYRKINPSVITLYAAPALGYQRSSRTDIHNLQWYDKTPLISSLVVLARKIKNTFNC